MPKQALEFRHLRVANVWPYLKDGEVGPFRLLRLAMRPDSGSYASSASYTDVNHVEVRFETPPARRLVPVQNVYTSQSARDRKKLFLRYVLKEATDQSQRPGPSTHGKIAMSPNA